MNVNWWRWLLVISASILCQFAWPKEGCDPIFTDNNIELCVVDELDYQLYNKAVYSLYGSLTSSDKVFKLSEEVMIEGIRSTQKINENLYFYKAYLGGNGVNAENRHVLLVIDSVGVYKAGKFSILETSENKGLPSFFRFEEIRNSDDELIFKKRKLVLDENTLQ